MAATAFLAGCPKDEPDITPPGQAGSFTATPGDGEVTLTWSNPTDADFAGVTIRRDTTGYPTDETAGTGVYDGTGTTHTDTTVTNDTTYYYSAFSYDTTGNYSAPSLATTTPAVPDITPPNLTQAIPAGGSTVGSLTSVTVHFSEAVTGADSVGSYTLGGAGAASLSMDSVAATSTSVYVITFTGSVSNGPITIDLSSIADLAGNALPATQIAYTGDLVNPTVVASPAGGVLINALTAIGLTYSEPVVGADTAANYGLSGAGMGTLAISGITVIDAGANQFQVELTGTPVSGAVVLTISNVEDLLGNPLVGNTVSFTFDATTPTNTGVVPVNGATISESQGVVIQFNESMDTASLVLSGSMQTDGTTVAWGQTTYPDDKVTITPTSAWSAGAADLTVNATDVAGNALSALALSYTVDAMGPTVSNVTPASGATISVSQAIVIQFNKGMNSTSLVLSGSMQTDGATVVWAQTTYPDDKVTITPTSAWSAGAANLTVNVNDPVGHALSPLVLSYTVDVGAPSVSTTPSHLGRMAWDTPIVLQFSEPMDSGSLNIALEDGAAAPVAFSGSYDSGTNSYTMNYAAGSWPEGELYLTIDGSDPYGNAMTQHTATFGVLFATAYVDGTSGSDANPGTLNLPLASPWVGSYTVTQEIATVIEVRVAAGTYSLGIPVLRNNVSVLGGYDATFTTRDPAANVATVQGNPYISPSYKLGVVHVGPGVVAGEVSGFRILANTDGYQSTGVYIDAQDATGIGTGFIIQDNEIVNDNASAWTTGVKHIGKTSGGALKILNNVIGRGSGPFQYGIYIDGNFGGVVQTPSVSVKDNTIIPTAGAPFTVATGIYVDSGNLSAERNEIAMGTTSSAYGIEIFNGRGGYISNNVIDINSFNAYAIQTSGDLDLSDPLLAISAIQNTILAIGDGTSGTGVAVYYDSTNLLGLQGNLWLSKGGNASNACIVQGNASGPIFRVVNNDFGCTNTYYDALDLTLHPSLATMESALATDGATVGGNIGHDPNFTNIAARDYHLNTTTPCTVAQGISSTLSTTDFDGMARPGGDTTSSMGAFEWDGACSATPVTWVP